jgi:hypothetical protein
MVGEGWGPRPTGIMAMQGQQTGRNVDCGAALPQSDFRSSAPHWRLARSIDKEGGWPNGAAPHAGLAIRSSTPMVEGPLG